MGWGGAGGPQGRAGHRGGRRPGALPVLRRSRRRTQPGQGRRGCTRRTKTRSNGPEGSCRPGVRAAQSWGSPQLSSSRRNPGVAGQRRRIQVLLASLTRARPTGSPGGPGESRILNMGPTQGRRLSSDGQPVVEDPGGPGQPRRIQVLLVFSTLSDAQPVAEDPGGPGFPRRVQVLLVFPTSSDDQPVTEDPGGPGFPRRVLEILVFPSSSDGQRCSNDAQRG